MPTSEVAPLTLCSRFGLLLDFCKVLDSHLREGYKLECWEI